MPTVTFRFEMESKGRSARDLAPSYRDISRIITCLATIEDALRIASGEEGWIAAFLFQRGETLVKPPTTSLKQYITDLGIELLRARKPKTPEPQDPGLIETMKLIDEHYHATADRLDEEQKGLQVLTLTIGSLEGVFADVFSWFRELFAWMAISANDLLPGRDSRRFYETAKRVISSSKCSEPDRQLAGGLVMIAGPNLQATLASLHVTDLKVN